MLFVAALHSASQSGAPDVPLVIALLAVTTLVAAAVNWVRIPYSVALVMTGLALALLPGVPRLQLTPGIILTVFLPVLLFHGAYNLDAATLRRNLVSITFLAVPGVVITAGLVGLVLSATTRLPLAESLVFGTIVAATDPVAVLGVFGEIGVPRRLFTIVAAESLLNDGTALVFFTTAVSLALARHVEVGATAVQFALAVGGSLLLGGLVGAAGAVVLQRVDDALIGTTITLILAYGGYLLADHFGVSGPLETVAAGISLGLRSRRILSPAGRLGVQATWEFLDFIANSFLFLLMGLAVRPIGELTASRLGIGFWKPLIMAILAVIAARIVVITVVDLLLHRVRHPLPRAWPVILNWAGLRGAVAAAAALSIPVQMPYRDLLLTLTFGIVFLTILGFGLTIKPLLARLQIGAEGESVASPATPRIAAEE